MADPAELIEKAHDWVDGRYPEHDGSTASVRLAAMAGYLTGYKAALAALRPQAVPTQEDDYRRGYADGVAAVKAGMPTQEDVDKIFAELNAKHMLKPGEERPKNFPGDVIHIDGWRYAYQEEPTQGASADAVPEGYVVVPVEPTNAMLQYGGTALDHPNVYMGGASKQSLRRAKDTYAAMIAAAPETPR